MMMASKSIARMLESMRREFGTGGNVIIYEQGRSYGTEAARDYISRLGGEFVAENLKEVMKLYQALGWFKLEGFDVDRKRSKITITTSENFECEGSVSKAPISQFVRGHLAGSLTASLGQKMECQETSCVATGAEYCTFVLQPK